jgi:hypothetical protein
LSGGLTGLHRSKTAADEGTIVPESGGLTADEKPAY